MKIDAPSIVDLSPKKLLGKHVIMSMAEDKTGLLWASFMPQRKQIQHQIGKDLYSLQVFPQGYFNAFNPTTSFENLTVEVMIALGKLGEMGIGGS